MRAVDADVLGIERAQRAERLAALRRQQMLLEGLHDDIGISITLTSTLGDGSRWRSSAATVYASRRDQLRHDLVVAQRQLGDALEAVHRAIAAAGE